MSQAEKIKPKAVALRQFDPQVLSRVLLMRHEKKNPCLHNTMKKKNVLVSVRTSFFSRHLVVFTQSLDPKIRAVRSVEMREAAERRKGGCQNDKINNTDD
jgi:hypothetical protein